MRRFLNLFVTLLVVLALATSAMAASTVTYKNGAENYIDVPGGDLFSSFKDVMPGDSLSQPITVRNDSSNRVRIYMRALGAQEGTDDFLSQMTLTVRKNADAVLFDAPANETAQLTEWVYLGTLSAGGEATLDVTLNVPIEMGNDYAQKIGYLDWQFKIEEIPDPPKTGDESNIALYTALAVVSLLLLTAVVLVYKRKKTA